MGLDMYAFTAPIALVGDLEVDLNDKIQSQESKTYSYFESVSELFYWRKFNSLHKWMKDLYFKKGGKDSEFNCNTVRLMPNDLDKLEEAAKNKSLKSMSGFFFGDYESNFSDEDQYAILKFVEEARLAIVEDNLAVIYNSYW